MATHTTVQIDVTDAPARCVIKFTATDADFLPVKNAIKALPYARFVPFTKTWEAEIADPKVARPFFLQLKGTLDGFRRRPVAPVITITPRAKQVAKDIVTAAAEKPTASQNRLIDWRNLVHLPDGMNWLPHQIEAIQWALEQKNGIVALPPGLGKTLIAAGIIAADRLPHVVWVCPEHLITDTAKHLQTHLPAYTVLKYRRDKMAGRQFASSDRSILLIGYASIVKDTMTRLGTMIPVDAIFFDESTYVKSTTAKRTVAAAQIAGQIQRRYLLSGTPMLNRPAELYSQLVISGNSTRMPDGTDLGDFHTYGLRFCGAHQDTIGSKRVWKYDRATRLDELRRILLPVMFRRTKEQCLDLPAKVRKVAYIDPVADAPEDGWSQEVQDLYLQGGANGAYSSLRRELGLAKTVGAGAYIRSLLDQDVGPLVAFGHHKDVLDRVAGHEVLQKYKVRVIYGDTSQKDMDDALERWRNGAVDLLLLSYGKAATGLTLTEAAQMVFIEPDYVPGTMLQAEDRIHRIGQTETVTYHYLVTEGLDERIIAKLIEKIRVIQTLIDGGADKEAAAHDDFLAEVKRLIQQTRKEAAAA